MMGCDGQFKSTHDKTRHTAQGTEVTMSRDSDGNCAETPMSATRWKIKDASSLVVATLTWGVKLGVPLGGNISEFQVGYLEEAHRGHIALSLFLEVVSLMLSSRILGFLESSHHHHHQLRPVSHVHDFFLDSVWLCALVCAC